MLEVDENNNIFITRGDTGVFNITLKDRSGNEYTPVSGDRLQFVVSRYWGGRPIKELTQDIVPVGDHTVLDQLNVELTTIESSVQDPLESGWPSVISIDTAQISSDHKTYTYNILSNIKSGSNIVVSHKPKSGSLSTSNFTKGTAKTITKNFDNTWLALKIIYDGNNKFDFSVDNRTDITSGTLAPIVVSTISYIAEGSMTFYLRPEVTEKLPFGGYVYHVKITQSNGNVSTVLSGRITLGTEAPWHFDASQNTYTSDSSSNNDSSSNGATATAQGVMVG